MTRSALKSATKQTFTRARTAGTGAAQRIVAAADAALVNAGDAAKRRQRNRAVKVALRMAGKAAVIAGTIAATAMAVRVARARTTAT